MSDRVHAGSIARRPTHSLVRARLVRMVVAGVAGSAAAAWWVPWQVTVLIGWCLAALVLTVSVWVKIWPADAERTRQLSTVEDSSRAATDLVLVVASAASLIGVGFVLLKGGDTSGLATAGITALAVSSVVLAWATVQTVFTLRYAHLYWSPTPGGVDFNQDTDPDYHDFAYLAFTIGMTYQVSDTNLTTTTMRRTALRHALVSYVFGAVIIAVTINVVASLAN
ncbi:MAG: hypothetical protein QOH79_664 [Acidimicrobiaceae bacterium]